MNDIQLKEIISECIVEEMPKAIAESNVIREHFAKEMHPFVQANLRKISDSNKEEALECIKECGNVSNISRKMANMLSVNEIKYLNENATNEDIYNLSEMAIYNAFFNGNKTINESVSRSLLREEIEESFGGILGTGATTAAKKGFFKRIGDRIGGWFRKGRDFLTNKGGRRSAQTELEKASSTNIKALKTSVNDAEKAQKAANSAFEKYLKDNGYTKTVNKKGQTIFRGPDGKQLKDDVLKSLKASPEFTNLKTANSTLKRANAKLSKAETRLANAQHGVHAAERTAYKRVGTAAGLGAAALAGGAGYALGRSKSGNDSEDSTVAQEPVAGGRGAEETPVTGGGNIGTPAKPSNPNNGGGGQRREPIPQPIDQTAPVVRQPEPETPVEMKPEQKQDDLSWADNRTRRIADRLKDGKRVSQAAIRHAERDAMKNNKKSPLKISDKDGNEISGDPTMLQQKKRGINVGLRESINRIIKEELKKRNIM